MAYRIPVEKQSRKDNFALSTTRTYLSGIEALVRLPILQHQRDTMRGLNTAAFISGYRGSPLGGLDQAMWRAQPLLEEHDIHFHAGLNEELAATAVWGSQQTHLFEGAKYDGVFSMWYGKGPGVDRSMDAIKHANAFGTSRYGGVLAVAGDDHACKSSTLPHQSEYMFMGASIPILNPANVQEVLDLGIYGWALSRYSGCWVALKTVTENMDSAACADVDPARISIRLPQDFELPGDGVHARWPDKPLEQERRLNKYKIYAARAFARANNLNRIVIDSPNPRFGIITTGKAYLDVLQALEDLGIDDRLAAKIGIRVYKVGMSWPLEPQSTQAFAAGLEEILVVEEKRSVIEDQLTSQLYNRPVAGRPRVVGEFDEAGRDLLPNLGELSPALVARAIAARVSHFHQSETMTSRLAFLKQKEQSLAQKHGVAERTPHFCSGCPHNTSTKVPEGSRAMGGIGCHYMAMWMPDRNTQTFSHMGGEGAAWIGMAPFTETAHVFQNLGDGTYFHSGILAIRAARAANINITYKVLYNDAVAMTGGQPLDGKLSVPDLVQQIAAEGIGRIALVSDAPRVWEKEVAVGSGFSLHHRDELEVVQRELRQFKGVSVIIYVQACAAEKRRRRKLGLVPDPARRVFINDAVCEGCGDCGTVSNCLSVIPKETPLGRKRQIDQSACNKDFSCINGFCPSFISVEGGEFVKGREKTRADGWVFDPLPDPELPDLDAPWNGVVAGIGGTGVMTVTALIAKAAHVEGKGCATLNQTGLAQKFGAVVGHVRIANRQEDIKAVRVPAGEADLLVGCDLAVAASDDSLSTLDFRRSSAVVNVAESPTAAFLFDPDVAFDTEAMQQAIREEVGNGRCCFIDAIAAAKELLGDSVASNIFLLGYACQKGLVPVSWQALERAIEINAVAVDFNKQAMLWGRRAAHQPASVMSLVEEYTHKPRALTLDELTSDRFERLVAYQNKRYAQRYGAFVDYVGVNDPQASQQLTQAVANSLYKLMAYKDEYEVARLHSNSDWLAALKSQFKGPVKVRYHLAPPLLAGKDAATGRPLKREFPGWTLQVFRLLAKLRFLRGTPLDFFGTTAERRMERQDLVEYEHLVREMLHEINDDNYAIAVQLAELPLQLRGFGPVKAANREKVRRQKQQLLQKFRGAKVVKLIEKVA